MQSNNVVRSNTNRQTAACSRQLPAPRVLLARLSTNCSALVSLVKSEPEGAVHPDCA